MVAQILTELKLLDELWFFECIPIADCYNLNTEFVCCSGGWSAVYP